MKNLLASIILVLFTSLLVNYSEVIYWDQRRVLQWTDFKCLPGSRVHENGAGAEVAFMITHSRFEIHAAVNQNNSWVNKSQLNDYGLSHEQGHFDIAEVYARKLRKSVSEFSFNSNSFNRDYDSLYQNIFAACDSEENLYDLQTEHSVRVGAQKDWKKRIENELSQYQVYYNPHILIKTH